MLADKADETDENGSQMLADVADETDKKGSRMFADEADDADKKHLRSSDKSVSSAIMQLISISNSNRCKHFSQSV